MTNVRQTILIASSLVLAACSFAQEAEPYAAGCEFVFSLNYTTNGTAIVPPPHASITCVNGIRHDENGTLNAGKASGIYTYCHNDLLVIEYGSIQSRLPKEVGCVMGRGPFKDSPPSKAPIVLQPNAASATWKLTAVCETTGSKVGAVSTSSSSTSAMPKEY